MKDCMVMQARIDRELLTSADGAPGGHCEGARPSRKTEAEKSHPREHPRPALIRLAANG